MIRGFYTALSGIVATMTRQSVVSDNIANVSTVGFKQSRSVQDDFGFDLTNSMGPSVGHLGTGTVPTGLQLDLSQGPIETTGLPTDLAISGDGLFAVATPRGLAYSRAGNFVLDATGALVTEQGYYVLDTAGGQIRPPAGFSVGPDGTIAETGQRIALVAWPTGGVSRLGENLYGAAGPLPPASGTIRQGALERSNVDLALSMTELMNLQRSFQLDARALSLQDGTIGEATQLGRLR